MKLFFKKEHLTCFCASLKKLCMIIFSCVCFVRLCMHTSDFCFGAFSSILNSESAILTNISMYIVKLLVLCWVSKVLHKLLKTVRTKPFISYFSFFLLD